jgi:hypothetical protein
MKMPSHHGMTDARPRTSRASLSAAMALALIAAATGGSATLAAEESAPQAPEPQFWSDVLTAGDCIVRPTDGALPEPISCDGLHEEEIYAVGRLDLGPDEPYPGDAISDMVGEQLCDAATVEFGGETWDLLPFATYWLYPIESEWEAGDRGTMCSAGPPEGITMKIGTAAGGGLDSDDVLLARGGFSTTELGELNEWVTVQEHSTTSSVGVVSDGQLDLPLRRASAVPPGFIFNATDRGDDGFATTTWGYTWETGEFTDLGSILPEWELASTMVGNGITVFAGRETPDHDWDVYGSTKEQGVYSIADGPGNQQYPTFTPDGAQVVFHDDGKLMVVDVDGSNERVLVERDSMAFESAVSPDGTLVAFVSDYGGNDDIWLVGIDGGDPANLTQHPANEAWPVWSADGSRIYFQTSRLRPENRVNSLVVMNADGSEASWFSGASLGQPLLLEHASVDDVVETLLTIDELYFYEPIEGEPGTTGRWEHSSGRLAIDLPVGWRVSEFDEGIGFVAAPRPMLFSSFWEADGVVVTLYDDYSTDDFFALIDETAAVQSCEQFDGTGGVVAIDDVVDGLAANHICGEEDAVAGVIAFYDNGSGVGVVIEGQRDNLPDTDTDKEMLDAIPASLTWS